ncbi:MAG: DUF6064 family protein [Hyphomicrobiaceae bacterium]
MSHWWAYPITDVIPFSLSVYIRFLVSYGKAMWPWQLVGLVVAAIVVRQMLGSKIPNQPPTRLLILLGMAWLAVAGLFFYQRYTALFWAGSYFAVLFVVQGLLLLGLVATGAHRNINRASETKTFAAALLFGASVFGYPLVAWLFLDIRGSMTEVFGLFPDPTVSATLAALAGYSGSLRWIAMIVPIIWCAVQTTIGTALAMPTMVALPALACLSLIVAVGPRRDKDTSASS